MPDWLITSSWHNGLLTVQISGIERGIAALRPCNLGLVVDLVIIVPILGAMEA